MKELYKNIAEKYIDKTSKMSNCYMRYLFIKHLRDLKYKEQYISELLGLNHSTINYYYNKYVSPSIDNETMTRASEMLNELNHLSQQINEISSKRYFAIVDKNIYIIEGNNKSICIDNDKLIIKINENPVELNEFANLINI